MENLTFTEIYWVVFSAVHDMIARLGSDHILHQHGRHTLLNDDKNNINRSWFANLRSLCQQYNLPDPVLVLQSPPTNSYWKSLTKSKVLDWWQTNLNILIPLHFSSPPSCLSPHPIPSGQQLAAPLKSARL